jgi:hypothetical protein
MILNTSAREQVHPIGTLAAFAIYENGRVDKLFEEKNLITTPAKQALLSVLYLSGVVSDPITQFRVGTGGAIDPQGLYPKQEDPTQTGLITQVYSVATTYILGSTDVSVTYLADVDQSSANGSLITEAGLFKASGLIFNVKNFPAIPKTSEFSIHFEWTIKYA